METKNELLFPLDLQLFADEKGKGDVIDADKELDKVPLSKIKDDDTDDDIDEDDIEDEDEEEDEDEDSDDDSDEDEDEEDEEEDSSEEGKKKDQKDDEGKKQDEKPGGDNSKPEDQKKAPAAQNRDVNHEQKLLRERREAEEKARKENFTKGFIAALGGKNPYTGEEIKDDDDIREAQVMIEAKKRGLDPIQDFHKMDKILRQEERAKTAKEEADKAARQKKVEDEIRDFSEKYPDEDIKDFLKTVEEKGYSDLVGNIPLTRIKSIIENTNQQVAKAVEDNDDMKNARRKASPGSASSGGDANGDFFTREELSKMSQAEIKANWAKVERSYERLNKSGKGGK